MCAHALRMRPVLRADGLATFRRRDPYVFGIKPVWATKPPVFTPVQHIMRTVRAFLNASRIKTGRPQPLWLVPQTFGGREFWRRQPTAAEARAQSYAAVVAGAVGLQFFARETVASTSPSSTPSWNTLRTVAAELQQLAPWLLSTENAPSISARGVAPGEIVCRGWVYSAELIVICVNTVNQPRTLTVEIRHNFQISQPTSVAVLWANRNVSVAANGELHDWIDGFGTRVFSLHLAQHLARPAPVPNDVANPSF
eukprot:SAG22_NODE_6696_length_822_cov_0.998617_1_plen_253_part_10